MQQASELNIPNQSAKRALEPGLGAVFLGGAHAAQNLHDFSQINHFNRFRSSVV